MLVQLYSETMHICNMACVCVCVCVCGHGITSSNKTGDKGIET